MFKHCLNKMFVFQHILLILVWDVANKAAVVVVVAAAAAVALCDSKKGSYSVPEDLLCQDPGSWAIIVIVSGLGCEQGA